jgi:hypothetical protein
VIYVISSTDTPVDSREVRHGVERELGGISCLSRQF